MNFSEYFAQMMCSIFPSLADNTLKSFEVITYSCLTPMNDIKMFKALTTDME